MFEILFFLFLCGIVVALIMSNRGHSATMGFIAGMLLGPFAILIALFTKRNEKAFIQRGDMKRCPHCADLIREQANVCRFCGRDV